MPEICLDEWTITYEEFQPWKSKQAKKRTSEETLVKVNPQNQQDSSTLATHGTSIQGTQHQDSTLGRPVSKTCYHCHDEGHLMRRCPKKYPFVYGNNNQKQGLVPKGSVGGALNNTSMKNQQLLDGRRQNQAAIGQSLVTIHEAQGQGSQVPRNKVKQNDIHGRLNHMDLCTACEAQNVVFGPILVNITPATVLFNSSSSHSFISSKRVADHKILMLAMRKHMLVKSPRGKIRATRICPKVSLDKRRVAFVANLIVLELMEIDVVLGRGWLSACHGVIKWDQRSVLLTTSFGERIEYEGLYF